MYKDVDGKWGGGGEGGVMWQSSMTSPPEPSSEWWCEVKEGCNMEG